jgi:hypothetical protein
MSPYGRTIGPLDVDIEMADISSWMGTDAIHNFLPNKANISAGKFDGLFDSTPTSGLNAIMGVGGVLRNLMVPIGIRAAPAMGDPCFCGVFGQKGFAPGESAGAMVTSIPFVDWDAASVINYWKPWGRLLHAAGAETGANTGVGIDDVVISTAAGGWLMYQIFASNAAGTATISIDDSDTNVGADFDPLTGATTTAIAFGSIPCAGVIPIGTTATIRQFLRWQLALAGGMTSCNFALTFIRA